MAVKQKFKNGLTEQKINSTCSEISNLDSGRLKNIDQLVQEVFTRDPDLGVFYLDYGARIGSWHNGSFSFYFDEVIDYTFIQEARIFDKDGELKIWREPDGFRYRLRNDTTGDSCFVIEAKQYLWGTKAEPLGNDWTRLYEDRGTEVIVPFKVEHLEGQAQPLAYVQTRNYISYLANGQASYIDCRFVKIGKR